MGSWLPGSGVTMERAACWLWGPSPGWRALQPPLFMRNTGNAVSSQLAAAFAQSCQHYRWSASLGEEPPTGKHHLRTWSVSIIALERFAWWGQCGGGGKWRAGGDGGVAMLRVWGPRGSRRGEPTLRIPVPCPAGYGGARCGSIREAKKA